MAFPRLAIMPTAPSCEVSVIDARIEQGWTGRLMVSGSRLTFDQMKISAHALFVTTLCCVLSSCGLLKRQDKDDESSERSDSNLIGVVEMVNPEQRFVLIRTESRLSVAVGQEVTAVDAHGVESQLKVTPEKKPHYLTADIMEGDPQTGSLVMVRGSKIAPPKESPPSSEKPNTSDLVPLPIPPEQPPPLLQTGAQPIPPQGPVPEVVPVTEGSLPPVVR